MYPDRVVADIVGMGLSDSQIVDRRHFAGRREGRHSDGAGAEGGQRHPSFKPVGRDELTQRIDMPRVIVCHKERVGLTRRIDDGEAPYGLGAGTDERRNRVFAKSAGLFMRRDDNVTDIQRPIMTVPEGVCTRVPATKQVVQSKS